VVGVESGWCPADEQARGELCAKAKYAHDNGEKEEESRRTSYLETDQ